MPAGLAMVCHCEAVGSPGLGGAHWEVGWARKLGTLPPRCLLTLPCPPQAFTMATAAQSQQLALNSLWGRGKQDEVWPWERKGQGDPMPEGTLLQIIMYLHTVLECSRRGTTCLDVATHNAWVDRIACGFPKEVLQSPQAGGLQALLALPRQLGPGRWLRE